MLLVAFILAAWIFAFLEINHCVRRGFDGATFKGGCYKEEIKRTYEFIN